MGMVVVIGLCAAAVAFLIWFEIALFRESNPFVMVHVAYHKAYIEEPEEELGGEEPVTEPAPAA